MIILTATQDDCLADMLRDAIEHLRATCLDAPAPEACDDCLSRIQAYRDLAGDLGLHGSKPSAGSADTATVNRADLRNALTVISLYTPVEVRPSVILDRLTAAARCPDCQGSGIVDVETDCGGCSGYPGIAHEPACGVEPCPRGCEVPAPTAQG